MNAVFIDLMDHYSMEVEISQPNLHLHLNLIQMKVECKDMTLMMLDTWDPVDQARSWEHVEQQKIFFHVLPLVLPLSFKKRASVKVREAAVKVTVKVN